MYLHYPRNEQSNKDSTIPAESKLACHRATKAQQG